MPPSTTLWAADEHTLAKHRILRKYLDAWIPIIASQSGRLILIDGFAGPGRYSTGEEGSPLVMLGAYLEHAARPRINAELNYVFIEQRQDRLEWLVGEINKIDRPMNVHVFPVQGDFAEVLPVVLNGMGGAALAPTFLFVDPFGYSDNPMELSGRVLSFPRCEVLIYVPLRWIARFLSDDGAARAFTSVYGDDRWMKVRAVAGIDERVPLLRTLFAEALGEHARLVRPFEMLDAAGTHGYHLFFGSQNETGLSRMKKAMWSVDPGDGALFRDPTVKGQQLLFTPTPDFGILLAMLRERFLARPFSIEAAERFVLLETPFLHDAHLKARTLAPAERDGLLEVLTPRTKRLTYPKGTRMRFKSPTGEPGRPSRDTHPMSGRREAGPRPSGSDHPTA
jgi:three-Cys-motif partner protein